MINGGTLMKRLLFILLSVLAPATTFAMMPPQPPQKQQVLRFNTDEVLKSLERYNPEDALKILQMTASNLCAQDELAAAFKEFHAAQILLNRTERLKDLKEIAKEKSLSSVNDLFAERFLQNFNKETASPEAIAFALSAIESVNDVNQSANWASLQEARNSENPEIRAIANDILMHKDSLEKTKKRDLAHVKANRLLIATEQLRSSTHKIYAVFKQFAYLLNPFSEFHNAQRNTIEIPSQKYVKMLQAQHAQDGKEKKELDKLFTEKQVVSFLDATSFVTNKLLPEHIAFQEYLQKKSFENECKFIEDYVEYRENCCKLYRAVRATMNRIGIDASIDFTMRPDNNAKYTNKLYDTTCTLPRELPESIEPKIEAQEETEVTPPLTPPTSPTTSPPMSPPMSPTTKAKKTKQKKQVIRKNYAPSADILAPPAPATAAQNPTAQPVAKTPTSLIKEVHDILNNMTIHLYCSNKQKKEVAVFARHSRINEWFEDGKNTLAKQGYLDPQNPKHGYADTAIAYHSFHLDVDPIAQKFGTQYEQTDKTGKRTLFIAIPGDIVRNGQRTFGIFGYAIDPETKLLYHRCFEPKTSQTLLKEYLDAQCWKVTLDDLAQA